jgi:hypothetical protein
MGDFVHHHVREGDEPFDNWWSKREFDLVPRAACQACNGGWMDKAEREHRVLTGDRAIGFDVGREADVVQGITNAVLSLLARLCVRA